MEIISCNLDDTQWLGNLLGKYSERGDIFFLAGDLGAGKTTLAQGILAGGGVLGPVRSPTFNLINEHEGKFPFYHMDMYRIDEEEADLLGLEEYFAGDGVVVLEWPERISSLWPDEYLLIRLEIEGDSCRKLSFEAHGDRYKEIREHLLSAWRDRDASIRD